MLSPEQVIEIYLKGIIGSQKMAYLLRISLHECNKIIAQKLGLDLALGYY